MFYKNKNTGRLIRLLQDISMQNDNASKKTIKAKPTKAKSVALELFLSKRIGH